MKGKIVIESAILIEKILMKRISEDKIPISYQNLLYLSEETTSLT